MRARANKAHLYPWPTSYPTLKDRELVTNCFWCAPLRASVAWNRMCFPVMRSYILCMYLKHLSWGPRKSVPTVLFSRDSKFTRTLKGLPQEKINHAQWKRSRISNGTFCGHSIARRAKVPSIVPPGKHHRIQINFTWFYVGRSYKMQE